MNYRINAKRLCYIAYYDRSKAVGKYEFNIDAKMWEEMTRMEQADVTLKNLRLSEHERNDLIAYWVDAGLIRAADAGALQRVVKQVAAEEKSEDDAAMAEIMCGDYGVEQPVKKPANRKRTTKKTEAADGN